MDVILLLCGAEFCLLFFYYVFWRAHVFAVTLLLALYFGLKYGDGDEKLGTRAWPALRRRFFFGKTVSYYFGNREFFKNSSESFLFVVIGNQTNMALFHGFGMHGGVFGDLDVAYMLPSALFSVPLVRDFLLWTGAVEHDAGAGLLKLLKSGRSVVYAPAGMAAMVNDVRAPDLDVFAFAIEHNIQVVPVLVENETRRYAYYYSRVAWWRQWPFCFCFCPRLFGEKPPPKLKLSVCTPIDPRLQETPERFRQTFRGFFRLPEDGEGEV